MCSTDDFFVKDGEYRFQPEKLEEYHRNNILRGIHLHIFYSLALSTVILFRLVFSSLVREAMKDGVKPIIVDNTNIFANHMEQYAFHVRKPKSFSSLQSL